MKITLLGFEFESSNKGCEALSYAFMENLNEILPSLTNEKVSIVNINIHDDLGKIPSLYPNYNYINIPVKLKNIKSLKKALKEIKSSDIVFDITHGDSFSDIYGKKWFFQTCLFKFFAINSKRPLILLPQTYGPYKSKISIIMAKKILNKCYKIYSRDIISTDYIKNLKIKNKEIFTTTDLAFALPYKENSKDKQQVKVGVNISGLLFDDSMQQKNHYELKTDYCKYCDDLISKLHEDGYEVHLVPHVICDSREGRNYFENDTLACEKVLKTHPYCKYESTFDTAMDVKSYISKLDVLISARMHASIAAYSSGCVSIPFAYSRKFNGLYKELNYNYVVDGRTLNTHEAVEKTLNYVKRREELLIDQNKGMKIVNRKLKEFKNDLKKAIEEIRNEE